MVILQVPSWWTIFSLFLKNSKNLPKIPNFLSLLTICSKELFLMRDRLIWYHWVMWGQFFSQTMFPGKQINNYIFNGKWRNDEKSQNARSFLRMVLHIDFFDSIGPITIKKILGKAFILCCKSLKIFVEKNQNWQRKSNSKI